MTLKSDSFYSRGLFWNGENLIGVDSRKDCRGGSGEL